eukprot:48662-Chlamydomonas_euryale.AAC.2
MAPAASAGPGQTQPSSSTGQAESHGGAAGVPGVGDGYEVTALALAKLGVKYMFGVVGIPVTPLASSAQVRAPHPTLCGCSLCVNVHCLFVWRGRHPGHSAGVILPRVRAPF